MGIQRASCVAVILAWLAVFQGSLILVNGEFNYKDALTKSIIFLEAQRSGKLPPNNRVPWRGDSALDDGKLAGVDLSGGYYDAGDNVKYGLPMAFTVTTLSWAAIFHKHELQEAKEMDNVREAIKWGTDYFLKCSSKKGMLYVQVGDPEEDHHCWVRPENMKTTRTVLKIDKDSPGTEIAAETAAAMASSSMVFRSLNKTYARRLLNKAKTLFSLAKAHKGSYDGECPFYCSFSGFNDELLWAAAWLYLATEKSMYLKYIKEEAISASVNEFSWDLKYAGAEMILAKLYYQGTEDLEPFKVQAESYICTVLPESPWHQIKLSPGGVIHLRDGANTQYVTGTAMLFTFYSDILERHNKKVTCGDKQFSSLDLLNFAKKQVDYILGKNPEGRSYMVAFGNNPPVQAHHRGASVPVMSQDATPTCPMSFKYLQQPGPNPNELTGAILGGPNSEDCFHDSRVESVFTEPCTYVNSQIVGPLAKFASLYNKS